MNEDVYYYSWKNSPLRAEQLFGRPCKIIARGTMNSVLVEFTDEKEPRKTVTSRWAIKMRSEKAPQQMNLGT